MMNFYKFMFFNAMISGTLLTISTLSWLMAWIGLEINLMAIIPLMKMSNIYHNNKYSAEAMIKYFIVQAMASAILLFTIVIFKNMQMYHQDLFKISSILITSALLMKLGSAPFHSWFPEVISGLKWKSIILLTTWQKIAPMIILTYSTLNTSYLIISILLSSMISGFQGLNQTCLRKIMAYSSINHVNWMICAIFNSFIIWTYYFLIYSLININIIFIFNKYKMYFLNQLNKLFSFNKNMKIMFMLNFLSLGGLPPFLGFLPKWMTVNYLIMSNMYFITFILIIMTLIPLFYYLRITFTTFIINSEESMNFYSKNNKFMQSILNFIILFSLSICTIMSEMF